MTATLEVVIEARRADDDNVVELPAAGTRRPRALPHERGEREIAAALVAGDRTALEAAFRRWADLVHGVARQLVGHDDADDVTQQVFVAAWRARETFDPARGEVPGWLVGITRNSARQHLRRRGPATTEILEEVDSVDADTTTSDQEHVVDALVVASALRDLPTEQRTVLELTLLHDLTQAETAARLEVPLGTVKSRHRRGLVALRETMGGRHEQ